MASKAGVMKPYVIFRAVVTFTVIAVAVLVSAQDESTPFRGETTVNVIEVPVRVYDKKTGEPVVGLTPADFVISENGNRQEITNFAELWRSEEEAVAAGVVEPPEGDKPIDDIRTRTVELIYLFDLYLMQKSDRNRALDGLRTVYQQGVPEGQKSVTFSFEFRAEDRTLTDEERDELFKVIMAELEKRGAKFRFEE